MSKWRYNNQTLAEQQAAKAKKAAKKGSSQKPSQKPSESRRRPPVSSRGSCGGGR